MPVREVLGERPLPSGKISGGQIAKGTAWMMLFKFADKTIGLISTLILARYLVPQDFGLVAMASTVVGLTELTFAFGFDTTLIQRSDARRGHFDTAWTFNLIFGLLIGILLVALAAPAAYYFREPRLELVLPVLALGALIGGAENIGVVAFRRNLEFNREFRFLLAKRLTPFAVTVTLAVLFQTFWSLIAGMVVGRVMAVFLSYGMHPYRPKLSLSEGGEIMHFSKWLLISNAVQFFHSRATDFVLGRTVGSHGLGIYNIAFEIATLPSTELIAPLNRAAYPVFSRLALNKSELLARFIDVFSLIGFLVIPISAGLACLADFVVLLLLGEKWTEAIPIVQVVAFSGLVSALQSNLYVVIVAMGKPKVNTILSSFLLVVSVPLIVFGSIRFGPLGAACAYALTSIVALAAIAIVFSRLTHFPISRIVRPLIRPTVAAMAMIGGLLALRHWLPINSSGAHSLLAFAGLMVSGAAIYLIIISALWRLSGSPPGAESTIHATLKQLLSRVRAPKPLS